MLLELDIDFDYEEYNIKKLMYYGVFWNYKNNKWKVNFLYKDGVLEFGEFYDEVEVVKVYDKCVKELIGNNVYLNFLINFGRFMN